MDSELGRGGAAIAASASLFGKSSPSSLDFCNRGPFSGEKKKTNSKEVETSRLFSLGSKVIPQDNAWLLVPALWCGLPQDQWPA